LGKAFSDLGRLKKAQSIIVPGDSGSDKTESTNHIIKCLTAFGGIESLSRRIKELSPLLKSLENAKTSLNNDMSRYGKFLELHFKENCIVGASVYRVVLFKNLE